MLLKIYLKRKVVFSSTKLGFFESINHHCMKYDFNFITLC
ncbi:hypothetical protein I600_2049 [Maribacter dokdonensis DSW-8]|nr:hypothetical protein I600_2049 [Maribacter dokdonensis DSW-8]